MQIGSPSPATNPQGKKKSRFSPIRDMGAIVWLVVLIVVVIFHDQILSSDWLAIHVTFLGALTHSALVWSEYFSNTLLKTKPKDNERQMQDVRSLITGFGALLVFVGFPMNIWVMVLVGACLVVVAVLWHATYLLRKMKKALPGRFRIVIRYYITAALMLPVGATFGVLLAFGFGDEWRGRLMIAHMTFNLLGWIGLTVVGTLVTFWPTMIRARMDERSERLVKQALWPVLAGIVIISGGALLGQTLISVLGVVVYAGGLVWWGRSLWKPIALKGIREFAPASVGAAMVWAIVGLTWIGAILATSSDWPEVTDRIVVMAPILAFGFALQILLGALSYLLPVLMGRSPQNVAVYQDGLNTWSTFRITVPNMCLLLFLLPVPDSIRIVVAFLGIFAIMTAIPIMMVSVVRGLKHRRLQEAEKGSAQQGLPPLTKWLNEPPEHSSESAQPRTADQISKLSQPRTPDQTTTPAQTTIKKESHE